MNDGTAWTSGENGRASWAPASRARDVSRTPRSPMRPSPARTRWCRSWAGQGPHDRAAGRWNGLVLGHERVRPTRRRNRRQPRALSRPGGRRDTAHGGAVDRVPGRPVLGGAQDRRYGLGVGDQQRGPARQQRATASFNLPVQVQTQSGAALTDVVRSRRAGSTSSRAGRTEPSGPGDGTRSGQLGSGATGAPRRHAAQVTQLAQVKAIAAGNMHALAVRQDGTVWAWGGNDFGALGTGVTGNQGRPRAGGGAHRHPFGGGGQLLLAGSRDGRQRLVVGLQRVRPARGRDDRLAGDATEGQRGGHLARGAAAVQPVSGVLGVPMDVTLTSSTTGATIHYTTDGSEPVQGGPGTLSVANGGSVHVDRSLTLKARAYKSGWLASNVASQAYTLTLAAVTVSPAVNTTYYVPQTVTLSHPLPDVVIRYTTDGSPVTESSPMYGEGSGLVGLLDIPRTTTVYARAFRPTGGGGSLAAARKRAAPCARRSCFRASAGSARARAGPRAARASRRGPVGHSSGPSRPAQGSMRGSAVAVRRAARTLCSASERPGARAETGVP